MSSPRGSDWNQLPSRIRFAIAAGWGYGADAGYGSTLQGRLNGVLHDGVRLSPDLPLPMCSHVESADLVCRRNGCVVVSAPDNALPQH